MTQKVTKLICVS